ncbi:MAG: hypothetical protein E6J14_07160 [Chloroflexi bacterium]|nr:MAG: hypothetical protein E6J14_07160 [Chloroflexota bacterium]
MRSTSVRHRSMQIARGRLSAAHAGLAAMSAVLAWEWTLSASHKITSDFAGQFPTFIESSIGQGRPGVVNDLLAHVVLRAPTVFALSVIALDVALAAVFAAAAFALFVVAKGGLRLVAAALAIAAATSLTFAVSLAVVNGDTVPWQLRGDAFESGVAVEYLLAGVSGAALIGAVMTVRRARVSAS